MDCSNSCTLHRLRIHLRRLSKDNFCLGPKRKPAPVLSSGPSADLAPDVGAKPLAYSQPALSMWCEAALAMEPIAVVSPVYRPDPAVCSSSWYRNRSTAQSVVHIHPFESLNDDSGRYIRPVSSDHAGGSVGNISGSQPWNGYLRWYSKVLTVMASSVIFSVISTISQSSSGDAGSSAASRSLDASFSRATCAAAAAAAAAASFVIIDFAMALIV
mmetsp:Transcript_9190/g.13366  ORF Transcript_9190/g.13366 Transcript_9190/m.13366 type:complete len:215 (-) Transcript_9190:904-1548(-)